jgi:hypothetical protein
VRGHEIVRIAGRQLKVRPHPVDENDVLILLTLLTAGYFAGVVWLRREARLGSAQRASVTDLTGLPDGDCPPLGAVGWPPGGAALGGYIDGGLAALDAYLSEGSAP